jgi:prophage antirepressor-like protein
MNTTIETNALKIIANPFQFADMDVRSAVDELGKPWFCAKDICAILDITWGGPTLQNFPDEYTCMLKVNMESGSKDVVFISEPGLYRLAFRSNKPKADEFTRWVCEVVLPEIRETGSFGTLDLKARIQLDKHIVFLSSALIKAKDSFQRDLLMDRLVKACNMANQPFPAQEYLERLDYNDSLQLLTDAIIQKEKTTDKEGRQVLSQVIKTMAEKLGVPYEIDEDESGEPEK